MLLTAPVPRTISPDRMLVLGPSMPFRPLDPLIYQNSLMLISTENRSAPPEEVLDGADLEGTGSAGGVPSFELCSTGAGEGADQLAPVLREVDQSLLAQDDLVRSQ